MRINKKIFLVLSIVAFLVFSIFGFRYFIKTNKLKNAEEKKYSDYQIKVKSAPTFAINQAQEMEILKNTQNDYEGTGVIFYINSDVVYITEVLNGSPADKAGLESGDKIIKIDNKHVLGMGVDGVSAALKGEKGTKVLLNIYRDSFNGFAKDFMITRDLIDNSRRRELLAFLEEGIGGEDLGNNYFNYKGTVYYWHDGSGQSVPDMAITDINKDKIETFNGGCVWNHKKIRFDPCDRFAKDDKKVYYTSYAIKEADPKTFELIEKGNRVNLSKDHNHVFYGSSVIENADPETFIKLSSRYEKDKARVYYGEWEIKGADPNSFLVIRDGFAKDKNGYYIGTEKASRDELLKLNSTK